MRPTVMALEDRRLLSMIGAPIVPLLDGATVVHKPTDTPVAPSGAHPDLGDPTIVVNNPTDTPKAGETDLRQAINQANTDGGNVTITFDPMVFSTPQTIALNPTLGQLELSTANEAVTITGPTARVTVSGGGAIRVFLVDSGVTASISGMTITGGSTTANGGGLYNDGGNVTLTNCTVSGNAAGISTALSGGGGICGAGGTTTLTNCTVSGNSAAFVGGGLFDYGGTMTLTNVTVSGNSSSGFGGGAWAAYAAS
jgi:hypothetical protein